MARTYQANVLGEEQSGHLDARVSCQYLSQTNKCRQHIPSASCKFDTGWHAHLQQQSACREWRYCFGPCLSRSQARCYSGRGRCAGRSRHPARRTTRTSRSETGLETRLVPIRYPFCRRTLSARERLGETLLHVLFHSYSGTVAFTSAVVCTTQEVKIEGRVGDT
jgi:hypothetical protein